MNTDDQPEQGRKARRTETPRIVYKLRLDPFALALYLHVLDTAGEDGVCYKSTKTLSEDAQMSVGKISASKQVLFAPREELGGKSLLVCEQKAGRHGGSPKHFMRVVDIWDENKAYWDEIAQRRAGSVAFSGSQYEPENSEGDDTPVPQEDAPASPSRDERDASPGSPHERAASYYERAGSPHEPIKTPGIKTPRIKEEKESRVFSGEAPAGRDLGSFSPSKLQQTDDPVVQTWPHAVTLRGANQSPPPSPEQTALSPPAALEKREEFKFSYPLKGSPVSIDAAWHDVAPTIADWEKIVQALALFQVRPVLPQERSSVVAPDKWLRERRWESGSPFKGLEILRRDNDRKSRDGPGRSGQRRSGEWPKKGGNGGANGQPAGWKSAHKQAHEL